MDYSEDKFSDGPYIFVNGDTVVVKWISRDLYYEKTFLDGNFKFIKKKFRIPIDDSWLTEPNYDKLNFNQSYTGVSKIAVISDVHGQYDLFKELLRNNKIINKKGKWIFGDGHLVILGDIFDRGDKVTESLWLVYNLEKQAEAAGGKLHMIIGNHEKMIIDNDIRYIHEKYDILSETMKVSYSDLFSLNSVLGRWIRTKPLIVTINDILFVHAGISPTFLDKEMDVALTNKLFAEYVIPKSTYSDVRIFFLGSNQGPIWYRGYFLDKNFTEDQLDKILNYVDKNHIIVGHTSHNKIVKLFNNKVIGVDSAIKIGESGEMLLIENGQFFRGTLGGKKKEL